MVGRTGNVNNIISDWTIISNMRDVDTILNILYLFWCRTCKFRNTRHVRFYPQWSWPLVLTWNSWSLAGWVVYQGSFLSISAYILSMTGSCSMLKMFFSPCSYTYNMISILNWSLLSYQYKATAASDAWTFNYFLTKNTSICKSPMVNLGWSWLRWIKTNLEVKLRALLKILERANIIRYRFQFTDLVEESLWIWIDVYIEDNASLLDWNTLTPILTP